MLTLNFHSIVKEIFKNSKGVYAYEYSFKPKKPETSFGTEPLKRELNKNTMF